MTDKASGPLLDRARIQELLNELGRRCAAHGIVADLLIVGGGAIALAYSNDRATRDIDAIFEPKMLVTAELLIDQGDTTPPASLTESLAKAVTAKMKAPPSGNTVIAA